ncbi:unnamed protein product [Effrenium voratum]|nr:unnamed protein product [Effrenium voratum]
MLQTPSASGRLKPRFSGPWNARSLIRERLNKQGELARRSPLRKVPVREGLDFFRDRVNAQWFNHGFELQKDKFVEILVMLLGHKDVPHNPREREDLYQIFDSMDFDGNGTLSTGEWASGLSVYFKGSTEEAVRAVFDCLDTNGNGAISKSELQAYIGPFIKAMSPSEAAALRPLLEKKAVDDIYYDMDMDHRADISPNEMLAWSNRGNNIVDKLADIIDQEVYQIWLTESKKAATAAKYSGYHSPRAGARNPQDPDALNSPSPNQSYYGSPTSTMHSEYGPPPSSASPSPSPTGPSGWFGGYFDGSGARSPESPASPSSMPPAPSAPATQHDPFAHPRQRAVPPPPPPPAPGRAAPAGGFAPPQSALSSSPYYTGPCQSSPQYRGGY